MKFAKELDEQAIPEWKGNYFDYKAAKKRIKAISKAIKSLPSSSTPNYTPGDSLRDGPVSALFRQKDPRHKDPSQQHRQTQIYHARSHSDGHGIDGAEAMPISDERSPLKGDGKDHGLKRMQSYGSIIGSPPRESHLRGDAPSLKLPAPAVSEGQDGMPISSLRPVHVGNAYEISSDPPIGEPISRSGTHSQSRIQRLNPQRTHSLPDRGGGRRFMQRMLSVTGVASPRRQKWNHDIVLEAYRESDLRTAEFYRCLDNERDRIEKFYGDRECEAVERLQVLREQLHIMRECRLAEIVAADRRRKHGEPDALAANVNADDTAEERSHTLDMLKFPLKKSIDTTARTFNKIRPGRIGKSSKAMRDLGTPEFVHANIHTDSDRRDYTRRSTEVSYRVAKRKMKIALAEYYRGLELLKAYALLNRTAFRKINKKYDKAVNAHPKLQYMNEKVTSAHFVASDEVDKLMASVEDLYARYFEKGNRKVAVSKLRTKNTKAGDYTGPVARTCALLGAGSVFGIQGLVQGAEILFQSDPTKGMITSYLLQLYAGYFLMLLLAFLFCGAAGIFNESRVNYQFIFELDTRQALNWLQMSELPSWLYFLLGIVLWFNFYLQLGGEEMYRYWIVVLITLATVLLFFPGPVFYHKARAWFIVTLHRLVLSGLYRVEFRDFFIGDMFCSLTYSLGNLEVFFCLFVRSWRNPATCNSSHSRLLGFLSTLPGIWRALQCINRYQESRMVFPHLVNCGKYGFTILQYMTLSLWRIHRTNATMASFVAMAAVNSVYCIIWDVFMDWSLGDMNAKHRFLRSILVYRKHVWIYYTAIPVDVVLRCNWIFYVVFAKYPQHSSLVSFLVAFSEVCRRGMWIVFRVENEHCTNIQARRAYKDFPLPYKTDEASTDQLITSTDGIAERDLPEEAITSLLGSPTRYTHGQEAGRLEVPVPNGEDQPRPQPQDSSAQSSARDGSDLERQVSRGGTLKFRRRATSSGDTMAGSPLASALKRVGSTMRAAHAQDYVKRKPASDMDADADSEDDDEEEEGEEEEEEEDSDKN